jgi:cytochrome oxidase Cu insertion factor (SCO1/SenC/PrrC family)
MQAPSVSVEVNPAALKRSRIKFLLLVLVCLSPVLLSYLTYYVIQPEGRTNYGQLVQPQQPLNSFEVKGFDGVASSMNSLKGKWWYVSVDTSACDEACQKKLYNMRQLRTITGRERDRVERLWLQTDASTPAAALLQEHEGLTRLVISEALQQKMLAAVQSVFGVQAQLRDHLMILDPMGNLMMVYPKDMDPSKAKKDILKLLKASRVG